MRHLGFTAIELLIVITLFTFLAAWFLPDFSRWGQGADRGSVRAEARQALRLARERSLAGVNGSGHGVYLAIDPDGHDSLVIYQGPSYGERTADLDEVVSLPASWEMAAPAGEPDINFSLGQGLPSVAGTVTLAKGQESTSVVIDELGLCR